MEEKESEIFLNHEYRRSVASLERFAEKLQRVKENDNKKKTVNLTKYRYIHPCFAVLVAAMPYVNNKTVIAYFKNDYKCVEFLRISGIYQHYTAQNDVSVFDIKKGAINFQIVEDIDKCQEVAEKIIDSFPVKLDEEAKNTLISKVYEVISNSFFHSQQNKVFCCGFFDNQGALNFSIYDFGVGIPYNVRSFLGKSITDSNALRWAWQQGHSTLKEDYPRGEGFHTLQEFAIENHGEIMVGSDMAYCVINSEKELFGEMHYSMPGTFFSMRIKKDFAHKYKKGKNKNIIRENLKEER